MKKNHSELLQTGRVLAALYMVRLALNYYEEQADMAASERLNPQVELIKL